MREKVIIYRTASPSLMIFSVYNEINNKALHLSNRKINIYWTHLLIRYFPRTKDTVEKKTCSVLGYSLDSNGGYK